MWFTGMMNLRTNIKLLSLFSFIFFSTSLGSFQGLVLCYGTDGHIHTEITFNGVDCGHFPKTAPDAPVPDVLKKYTPTPHTNHCISCIDIPLSFDYSLKNFDHTKNQRTASKLPNSSSLLLSALTHSLTTAATALSINQRGHISATLNLIHSTILLL